MALKYGNLPLGRTKLDQSSQAKASRTRPDAHLRLACHAFVSGPDRARDRRFDAAREEAGLAERGRCGCARRCAERAGPELYFGLPDELRHRLQPEERRAGPPSV